MHPPLKSNLKHTHHNTRHNKKHHMNYKKNTISVKSTSSEQVDFVNSKNTHPRCQLERDRYTYVVITGGYTGECEQVTMNYPVVDR